MRALRFTQHRRRRRGTPTDVYWAPYPDWRLLLELAVRRIERRIGERLGERERAVLASQAPDRLMTRQHGRAFGWPLYIVRTDSARWLTVRKKDAA